MLYFSMKVNYIENKTKNRFSLIHCLVPVGSSAIITSIRRTSSAGTQTNWKKMASRAEAISSAKELQSQATLAQTQSPFHHFAR